MQSKMQLSYILCISFCIVLGYYAIQIYCKGKRHTLAFLLDVPGTDVDVPFETYKIIVLIYCQDSKTIIFNTSSRFRFRLISTNNVFITCRWIIHCMPLTTIITNNIIVTCG